MTHDAETVERVAKAIHEKANFADLPWDYEWEGYKDNCKAMARAALSALPPQQVGVQEVPPMTVENAYGKAHSLISYTNGYNAALRDVRALSEKPHE